MRHIKSHSMPANIPQRDILKILLPELRSKRFYHKRHKQRHKELKYKLHCQKHKDHMNSQRGQIVDVIILKKCHHSYYYKHVEKRGNIAKLEKTESGYEIICDLFY